VLVWQVLTLESKFLSYKFDLFSASEVWKETLMNQWRRDGTTAPAQYQRFVLVDDAVPFPSRASKTISCYWKRFQRVEQNERRGPGLEATSCGTREIADIIWPVLCSHFLPCWGHCMHSVSLTDSVQGNSVVAHIGRVMVSADSGTVH
jgi:hypothetical protein